jgi:hypothetical protein
MLMVRLNMLSDRAANTPGVGNVGPLIVPQFTLPEKVPTAASSVPLASGVPLVLPI